MTRASIRDVKKGASMTKIRELGFTVMTVTALLALGQPAMAHPGSNAAVDVFLELCLPHMPDMNAIQDAARKRWGKPQKVDDFELWPVKSGRRYQFTFGAETGWYAK